MRCIQWLFATIVLLAAIGCGNQDRAGLGAGPGGDPKLALPKSPLGTWKSYSPPDGSFRASFPLGNPAAEPFTGFDPNLHAPFLEGKHYRTSQPEQYGERFYLSVLFDIAEIKYAPNTPEAEREKALDDVQGQLAELGNFKWPDPKPVIWGDQPASEYVVTQSMELPSGSRQVRTTYRVLATKQFAFIGSVRDMGKLGPGDEAKFFDSFELANAASSKK
jgi:hypothetical protein